MDLKEYIREVPDFPKPGILFYDITPLLANGKALRYAIDSLAERFQGKGVSKILSAEARGFILGSALAYKMGVGFIPVRKPGKLPYKTSGVSYQLEYGTDELQIHVDAIDKGENILLVDDVLATGGTMAGMVQHVENAGGRSVGIGFLIELGFLNGKAKLKGIPHESLLVY